MVIKDAGGTRKEEQTTPHSRTGRNEKQTIGVGFMYALKYTMQGGLRLGGLMPAFGSAQARSGYV